MTDDPKRASSSSDDWEDETPAVATSAPAFRPQEYPATPRPQSSSARAAFRAIGELSRKFDDHAKADQEALVSVNKTLTGILVENARTATALEGIAERARDDRAREIAELGIVRRPTTPAETISGPHEVAKAKIDGRTRIALALIGGAISVATALVTALATGAI